MLKGYFSDTLIDKMPEGVIDFFPELFDFITGRMEDPLHNFWFAYTLVFVFFGVPAIILVSLFLSFIT
jgi:hypothetical protein